MINRRPKMTCSTSLKHIREPLLFQCKGFIKKYIVLFIHIGLIATLIPLIFLTPVFPQTQPSITIQEIEPEEYIRGRVEGLNPAEYERYKVVVYVKTDKWYIHPYERGGPGRSYATIKKDGTWIIGTVKREFLADYVVALLVGIDYEPPSTVRSLGTIDFIARDKEEGRGRL